MKVRPLDAAAIDELSALVQAHGLAAILTCLSDACENAQAVVGDAVGEAEPVVAGLGIAIQAAAHLDDEAVVTSLQNEREMIDLS